MYGNNGYGQGYGQQQMGDFYDRYDNTRPVGGVRDPFIASGPHELAVISITESGPDPRSPSAKKGPKVTITFEVLQSQAHRPGSRVVKFYYVTEPSRFPGGTTDADRFADFIKKLKNIKDPNHRIGQDIRTLLRDRAAEQLARGMRIRAQGSEPKGAKGFVEVYWEAIDQTPQEIAQHRQRIESTPGLVPGGGAAPAQQGYGQQGGYQPPQGYAAPQQAPQGYAPQAPPTPPQPQGAPQQPAQGGGFLSQIPGFGQGPQGGNQGGSPPPAAW